MNLAQIAERVRCGACGGKMETVNIILLDRKAHWNLPTAGNILTGEEHRAVGVVCSSCVATDNPCNEAIEFVGRAVVYHRVESLPMMPPTKTYQLVGPSCDGNFGIECLRCGLVSWHIEDVRKRYCGNCHEFHHVG